jgi:hypothetical protein
MLSLLVSRAVNLSADRLNRIPPVDAYRIAQSFVVLRRLNGREPSLEQLLIVSFAARNLSHRLYSLLRGEIDRSRDTEKQDVSAILLGPLNLRTLKTCPNFPTIRRCTFNARLLPLELADSAVECLNFFSTLVLASSFVESEQLIALSGMSPSHNAKSSLWETCDKLLRDRLSTLEPDLLVRWFRSEIALHAHVSRQQKRHIECAKTVLAQLVQRENSQYLSYRAFHLLCHTLSLPGARHLMDHDIRQWLLSSATNLHSSLTISAACLFSTALLQNSAQVSPRHAALCANIQQLVLPSIDNTDLTKIKTHFLVNLVGIMKDCYCSSLVNEAIRRSHLLNMQRHLSMIQLECLGLLLQYIGRHLKRQLSHDEIDEVTTRILLSSAWHYRLLRRSWVRGMSMSCCSSSRFCALVDLVFKQQSSSLARLLVQNAIREESHPLVLKKVVSLIPLALRSGVDSELMAVCRSVNQSWRTKNVLHKSVTDVREIIKVVASRVKARQAHRRISIISAIFPILPAEFALSLLQDFPIEAMIEVLIAEKLLPIQTAKLCVLQNNMLIAICEKASSERFSFVSSIDQWKRLEIVLKGNAHDVAERQYAVLSRGLGDCFVTTLTARNHAARIGDDGLASAVGALVQETMKISILLLRQVLHQALKHRLNRGPLFSLETVARILTCVSRWDELESHESGSTSTASVLPPDVMMGLVKEAAAMLLLLPKNERLRRRELWQTIADSVSRNRPASAMARKVQLEHF